MRFTWQENLRYLSIVVYAYKIQFVRDTIHIWENSHGICQCNSSNIKEPIWPHKRDMVCNSNYWIC